MTTTNQELTRGIPYPPFVHDAWRKLAFSRLNSAYRRALPVPFTDRSRFVLFSDLHRGDNGRLDEFTPNEGLFLHALRHYWKDGFTYIEVGDGDELWYNLRLGDIVRAHQDVYDLLHQFDQNGRLYLIAGNHDTQSPRCDHVIKDGMLAHESVLLEHDETGQTLFVVHGHQADLTSWRLHALTRVLARSIWKKVRMWGIHQRWGKTRLPDKETLRAKIGKIGRGQSRQIEERMMEWAEQQRQTIICGHTHLPMFARSGVTPYFNTGSGVTPGYVTGLEIQQGQIIPIRWVSRYVNGVQTYGRELMGRPQPLRQLSPIPSPSGRVLA